MLSSTSFSVNAHYPRRVRPSVIWPIFLASRSPHHAPDARAHPAVRSCPFSASVLAHALLTSLPFPKTPPIPVLSTESLSLGESGSVLLSWRTPLSFLRLTWHSAFSWLLEDRDLDSSTPRPVSALRAFANQRVHWQRSYLPSEVLSHVQALQNRKAFYE